MGLYCEAPSARSRCGGAAVTVGGGATKSTCRVSFVRVRRASHRLPSSPHPPPPPAVGVPCGSDRGCPQPAPPSRSQSMGHLSSSTVVVCVHVVCLAGAPRQAEAAGGGRTDTCRQQTDARRGPIRGRRVGVTSVVASADRRGHQCSSHSLATSRERAVAVATAGVSVIGHRSQTASVTDDAAGHISTRV